MVGFDSSKAAAISPAGSEPLRRSARIARRVSSARAEKGDGGGMFDGYLFRHPSNFGKGATLGFVNRAELLAIASGHRTMEHVIQWVLRSGFAIETIVVQDEYTHDVVVRAGDVFLVYDTT